MDLQNWFDGINRLVKESAATEEEAFAAGRECGLHGANEENCRLRYFRTPKLTSAWERGKKAASNS